MAQQTTEMKRRENGGAESQTQQNAQLARWSPFALLDELTDELARFWGRPMGRRSAPERLLAQLPLGGPRLDVFEKGGKLIIKADLPGVKKEDVQVEVDDGDIVIQGETRRDDETREDQYYRMERSIGRFYRRVPLPFDVKPEDVEAKMSDGVLEIRVPKPPEAKRQGTRVPVK
jgi:HSP20 family protein